MTLDAFLPHVDYAVAMMGLEHVGLGGDFARRRGYAEAAVAAVMGRNLRAFLRRALPLS